MAHTSDTTMSSASDAAVELLRLLSCLSSEPLLEDCFDGEEAGLILAELTSTEASDGSRLCRDALTELASLSTVRRTEDGGAPVVTLDRAVAETTFAGFTEGDRAKYVKAAARLLAARAPADAYRPESWDVWRVLFPHAERIANCSIELLPKDELNAALLHGLALFFLGRGRYEEGLPWQVLALEAREIQLGPKCRETQLAKLDVGLFLCQLGREDEGARMFEEVLAAYETMTDLEGWEIPEARYNIATSGASFVTPVAAKDLLETAITELSSALGADHWRTRTAEHALASCLRRLEVESSEPLGDKSALELAEEILKQRKADLPTNHPDTIDSVAQMAALYEAQGDLEEAMRYRAEALEMLQAVFGREHPRTLDATRNLAFTLSKLGRDSDAEPLLSEVLSRCERVFDRHHNFTIETRFLYGKILQNLGRLEESVPHLRATMEGLESTAGEADPNTRHVTKELATLLKALGRTLDDACRHAEAEPFLREAVELVERIHGPESIELALAMNQLAVCLREQHKAEEAIRWAERAFEMDVRLRPASDPKIPHRLSNLSLALLLAKKLHEAAEANRAAWAVRPGGDVTSGRILCVRVALAMLLGESYATALGQLRTLLGQHITAKANVASKWPVNSVVRLWSQELPDNDAALLEALVSSLDDGRLTNELEQHGAWASASPVDLGVPWPLLSIEGK